MMTEKTDQQLVKQYLAGKNEALEIMIQRYLKPIYGFIYHYVNDPATAEDITQDVFIKVWRKLKKFNQNQSFKAWIYAIARNTAIDFLRRKKTLPFSEFDTEDGKNIITENLADTAPLPPELFDRADLAKQLDAALDRLPDKYRTVLVLHYQHELTFQEVAASLEKPLNTIKSHHQRALIKLREILLGS